MHAQPTRLNRLIGYLETDPQNLSLLADAADAAVEEGDTQAAATLIERYAGIAPLTPALLNLLAVCALVEVRFSDAAAILDSLIASTPDDQTLQSNLARAKAGMGDYEGVLAAIGASPHTSTDAVLTVQAYHHLGRLAQAIELGKNWSSKDEAPELWGALASVALDADETDLAVLWASRAPSTADGVATRGLLALAEGATTTARQMFTEGLAHHPKSARLRLGMGTVLLNDGDARGAAEQFDSAAETFGDHLGSWTAAGWAWLLAADTEKARTRFQHVVALDDTFGEGHGGLAVIALQLGQIEEAQKRSDIALRLDKESLGGLLTRSLLLEQAGDTALATRIRQGALNASIGPEGQSILQMAAKLAVNIR